MYNYHRNGLDLMADNEKKGKENIAKVFDNLKAMNNARPNSFLMRVFFDAKANEILDIFSGGPKVNITEIKDVLNRIAPTHASKWREITYWTEEVWISDIIFECQTIKLNATITNNKIP